MDWQGWFTLAVLVCMIIALVREVLGPDIVVFIALGVLVCSGILTPREAVIGFSNKGMLTVAILFVVAASSSFATPISYQTNMIVYGPGGYRFSDFLKTGIPLNLLLWFVAVFIIPFFWNF